MTPQQNHQNYDVAAYIWPSYHDEPRAHLFWPGYEGEWINVRTSTPKFPGHKQPRHPLWGDQNEADRYDFPFFPSVSVGWDNNARFPGLKEGYVLERTPEIFRQNLKAARTAVDKRGLDPKLILICAWNEWTEDSYLLPDREYGYGYLEAVRDVFGGRE